MLGLFIFTLNVQAQAPENFTKAKEIAKERIYYDQNQKSQGTIYCGCDWEWVGKSGGRVDLASCGYQVRTQQTRVDVLSGNILFLHGCLGISVNAGKMEEELIV